MFLGFKKKIYKESNTGLSKFMPWAFMDAWMRYLPPRAVHGREIQGNRENGRVAVRQAN